MRLINFKKITSAALTFTLTLNLLFGVIPLTGGVLAQEATPDSVLPETLVEETTAMSVDTISSDPTPSPEPTNSTDSQIQEPVIEKVESPQSEILTTAEIVPTEATTLVWERLDDSTDRTVQKVAEGVDYRFRDTNVVVRFTKLTTPGYLTIKEVKLSEEQKKNLGALSDTAYDITSDMQDGTFNYNLTLPNPDSSKETIVKYSEDGAKFVELSSEKKDSVVLLNNLDHFTIFVVSNPSPPPTVYIQNIVDNSDSGFETLSGTWRTSTSVPGYYGANYVTTDDRPGGAQVRWNFVAAQTGTLRVFTRWTSSGNRGTSVPFTVTHDGGSTEVSVNQEMNGGNWYSLGDFQFTKDNSYSVTLTNNATDLTNFVIGDAIKVENIDSPVVTTPAIIAPLHNSFLTSANLLKIDWTDSVDETGLLGPLQYQYQSFSDSAYSVLIYPGSWLSNSEIPTPGTPEGVYYLQVRARDAYGNITPWSNDSGNPYKVTVDNTAPSSPVVISPSHTLSVWENDRTIEVSWSSTDPAPGAGVAGYSYVWNTNPTTDPDTISEGLTTSATSLSQSTSQSIYFHIRAVDGAGNWGPATHYGPFWVDANNPSVFWITPLSNDYLRGTVNLEASASDIGSGILSVLFRIKPVGGTFTNISTDTSDPYQGNLDTLTKVDGNYVLRARALDYSGRSRNVDINVTIDNTAPAVSWVTPNNEFTISGAVDLEVTASDGLTGVSDVKFQYKRNDDLDTFHDIAVVTGPYTSPWDTTSLPLDFYTLRAIATDNAGNESYVDLTVGVAAVITSISSSTPAFGQIEVIWTTDRPTDGRLLYDTANHPAINLLDANYGYANSSGIVDPGKSTSHTVLLSGLNDNTRYYWRVASAGSPTAISDEYYNNTFSVPGAPLPPGGASGGSVAGVSTVSTLGSTSSYSYSNYGESDGEVLAVENEEEPIEATPAPTLSPEVKGTDVEETWISSYWWVIPVALLVLLLLFVLLRRKRK